MRLTICKCDVCKREIPEADVIGVEQVVVEPGVINLIINKGDGEADGHACGMACLIQLIAEYADKNIGAGSKKPKDLPVETETLTPEVCCEQGGERCGVHCRHRTPHPHDHECEAPACISTFWPSKPPCTVKGATEFTLPPTSRGGPHHG